ncbi:MULTISPECIES: VanZ family protein [Pseudoalteromonas]|uniref:VanZ like family n=1 Tax=Pseudoalteromonas luteoviolacea (strain 2ta16) TaxID=1353533 RepID=V4JDC1_PSEL2|nr:VanZ family protein [Pseudoalteromonas luteoviolacea]ESP93082.1 VanZ like family [Pseudoalteromonas luteoviolacea 2ta16]KZN43104.1 hypothetical protein N483_09300 [Pseudoalteromonas luteoviolacea NCIMB 1944]MCG7549518.1 VanZ family protein [Pseudoalteromonas sp. Of7M-16]
MLYRCVVIVATSFLAFICYMVYLANTGGHSIFFELVQRLPYGDKIGHFVLFMVLSSLVNAAWKFKTRRFLGWRVYQGSLFVLLFVVIEESSQLFIPSRSFDPLDFLANLLGVLVGTMFCRLVVTTARLPQV